MPIRNPRFSLIALAFACIAFLPGAFAQDDGAQSAEQGAVNKEAVRDYLLELLADPDEAAADDAGADVSYDQTLFEQWEDTQTNKFSERLAQLRELLPHYPRDIAAAFARSASREQSGMQILFLFAVIFIIGAICEIATTRSLLRRLYAYVDSHEKNTALKYKYLSTRVIIQVIGVSVLGVATFAGALLAFNPNPYLELLFWEFWLALIKLRLWMILLRNIFSPRRTGLRPIPLEDKPARELYFWASVFLAIIEFGTAFANYLGSAGLVELQVSGIMLPYTLPLQLIIYTRIWKMRRQITDMFVDKNAQSNFAGEFLSYAWPFMLTAWLLFLWLMWMFNTFIGEWENADIITRSWWITLAFPLADRLFHAAVAQVKTIQWLQSPTYARRSGRFVSVVQNGFRLLMVGCAVFFLSQVWAPGGVLMRASFEQNIFGQIISLLVIATIAYVVWELLHALIERNLPEEVDAVASLEGDAGGEGLSRAETLLPLMRTVITVVLVIFLLLSVLHALGVAIGPLLAGAGVVGIAIGFGAQKLVQDILSGIFFLIDDAFRRGEYIEIDTLKGTVEKISLRSMQLRHHLGAVQTIPYSEVRTVKNLSRDWVTMKLEMRLSYDSDIEKIRKIIKKVGQEMLADETMGPNFILPLKSQGVMRVEESALIMRMKFTAKPGEQWVIRREAYRRVRDALAAADIHFAHREVRVRLPEEFEKQVAGEDEPDEAQRKRLAEAAAAAAGGMLAAEAAKQEKLDDDDDDGGDDR